MVEISSNYSILNQFMSDDKKVTIFIKEDNTERKITIHLRPIKDYYLNNEWATIYVLLTQEEQRRKIIPNSLLKDKQEPLDQLKVLFFQLSLYVEYDKVLAALKTQLSLVIENFSIDYNSKELLAGDVIITSDICNYIIYILKLSCGEREPKPKIFQSESARQLYLAQLQFEKQINSIKNNGAMDNEHLIKVALTICYCFPSLTFDYLFNQTMAQIRWLHKYAAASTSYDIMAQAYAAGNLKKGKTPDFFIK